MSNLLEQAIVDAAALREVAMKNAEAALIEKYSKEFKQSVEKLLEQETPVDAGTESPELADPMAVTPEMGAGLEDAGAEETEQAFEDVPSSFLDGGDDDMITIDFDQLKKQISSALGGSSPLLSTPEMAATPTEVTPMMENIEIDEEELEEAFDTGLNQDVTNDALRAGVLEEDELEEEKAYEDMLLKKKKKNGDTLPKSMEEELEEEELQLDEEEELEEDVAAAAAGVASAKQTKASAISAEERALGNFYSEYSRATSSPRTPVAEGIEISEEELQELAEELKVDINIDNLSDGHMGTTVTQKREQRNLELAAARNSKAVESREEEEKAMSDLKVKLEESTEIVAALYDENKELEEKMAEMAGYLETLKENVEKLSISNAKLLYTNKVLGNASLNERQKEQIVENISKSTSVLEAKTIYNTLQGTVSGVNSNKPKESLSEALIRGNNSPFLTRKQQTAELPFADRMKKLAGIQ